MNKRTIKSQLRLSDANIMLSNNNNLLFSKVPSGMPKRVESSSWRCLWTWILTVTRSSTPISHAPLTRRTSASSLQLSKTPSFSSTLKNTTWCEGRKGKRRERERVQERDLQPHTHKAESASSLILLLKECVPPHSLPDQHYPCSVPCCPQGSLMLP